MYGIYSYVYNTQTHTHAHTHAHTHVHTHTHTSKHTQTLSLMQKTHFFSLSHTHTHSRPHFTHANTRTQIRLRTQSQIAHGLSIQGFWLKLTMQHTTAHCNTQFCHELQHTQQYSEWTRAQQTKIFVQSWHTATNYNTQHTAKNYCREFFKVHTVTRILWFVASSHAATKCNTQYTVTNCNAQKILRLYTGSAHKEFLSCYRTLQRITTHNILPKTTAQNFLRCTRPQESFVWSRQRTLNKVQYTIHCNKLQRAKKFSDCTLAQETKECVQS